MRYVKIILRLCSGTQKALLPEFNRLINTKWDIQFTSEISLQVRYTLASKRLCTSTCCENKVLDRKTTIFGNVCRFGGCHGFVLNAPWRCDSVVTWSDVYDLHGNHCPNRSQIKHTPVTRRHERLSDTHISEET